MLGELANQFGTEVVSPDKMKSGNILTPFESYKDEIKEPIKDDFNNNERRFID